MARKAKTGARTPLLKEETMQGILAVFSFVLGLVLFFASFHKAGRAGELMYGWMTTMVGVGFYLLPILAFFFCFAFLKAVRGLFPLKKTAGTLILFLSGLAIVGAAFPQQGGVVGHAIASPLIGLFDLYMALALLAAVFVISLLVIFDASLPLAALLEWIRTFRRPDRTEEATETDVPEESTIEETGEPDEEEERGQEEPEDAKEREVITPPKQPPRRLLSFSVYAPPSLSLLESDHGKPGVGDIKSNANIIKRTLQNFGIEVEMDEISIGPSVTRYALKPAESVRLSKIVALQRELELALAAHPLRIEAPIPGKSQVGIEIPNHIKATVGLATMLGSPDFASSDKPLLLSLGKDLAGKAHFANLSKMPHLLIAGTTGSGKSVTIHTLITSLLFRNGPQDLKLILIDPKRVELTLYNKIPHLLTPVITDAKKAILALKWAAKEMDRRYDILESESVRDIQSYHRTIITPELEKLKKAGKKNAVSTENESTPEKMPDPMPFIVIVIDELADIMSSYPRELEAAIVRLAQMSRAVGIHLILSTQRPSVNVITGLIKANIPARIALQVSSQIDSRTILDTGGAEKLLGAGDLLFLSGEMSKPARLQSAFMSEGEVKKVTAYLAKAYKDEPPSDLFLITGDQESSGPFAGSERFAETEEIDDTLYEEARAEVLKIGRASTSYLQRKLRVGYSRAARLIDMLEERKVIGPQDGSKPRSVVTETSTSITPADEEIKEENETTI